ncbi:hypothetical protein LTR62_003246 [Meristemomyces frigidus]|uniref:Serine aminopeptidase S33 domain-containing protein n=1 Tax=Meristemomyces frigidus TaxID=1508187 RepID=A0AAN7TJQ5_9PEZI|nr:hypothetical protein LTR62_003246 [Meristemomyces frigidus]
MDLIPLLTRHLNLNDKRTLYIALTTPIIGYLAFQTLTTLLTSSKSNGSHSQHNILESPRKVLHSLSPQELDELPYPSDALPGRRDVETPYGSIRVYEWGPMEGRKVLFVHGISTPCIAFAPVARLLVSHGFRVMLFDLFGRGYSDTPDPTLYPQNIGLFTSQILLVLASSPLSWTGTAGERFTVIGYSLGGGIAAGFTSFLPHMIESLVLIAPSGLLRHRHISRSSRWLYGGLLPRWLVNYYVRKRIGGDPEPRPRPPQKLQSSSTLPLLPVQAIKSEMPTDHPALAPDSSAPLFPDRPWISPASIVNWQLNSHPGFLPAFISSIQHAPIRDQHERWRIMGRRQGKASRKTDKGQFGNSLKEGKVLVLLGRQDEVILAEEVGEDAREAFGEENVEVVVLEGGHDVPIVNARGCVDSILGFLR